jgi:hypothetical protein
MEITHKLRKRFVKDYKLPITVLQDPYFEYYIQLYQGLFGSKDKYEVFCALVEKLGGEGPFFAAANKVINSAVESIKEGGKWDKFRTFDMNDYAVDASVTKGSVYRADFDGFQFVSIDLVKANFQALNHFDPELVLGVETYAEFLAYFTSEPYFVESKQIRQVIFGNANPKRQQAIQRHLMGSVVEAVKSQGWTVVSATSDEVNIIVAPDLLLVDAVEYLEDTMKKKCSDLDLHIRAFTLDKIGDKPYFKKAYLDGTYELKGVPGHYFAEVYRRVLGDKPTEYDMLTYYDGRIVQFREPLFG